MNDNRLAEAEGVEEEFPRVFVSYSWDDEEHKKWVRRLATDLRKNGVESLLDQWYVKPGSSFLRFMNRLNDADKVVVVCTPKYLERVTKGKSGGVPWETMLITVEMFEDLDTEKFIPILRTGSKTRAIPSYLRGNAYLDFRKEDVYRSSISELLDVVHGYDVQAPSVEVVQLDTDGKPAYVISADNGEVAPSERPRTEPGPLKPRIVPTTRSGRRYGVIVAADITNSTFLGSRRLILAMEAVLDFAAKHQRVEGNPHVAKAGNLDGVILTFTDADHQAVLDFCEAWIREVHEKHGIELRIGVHFGWFVRFQELSLIIGAGPNECSRIVQLAGPSQIIVSEDFVEDWVKNEPPRTTTVYQHLQPGKGHPPHEVAIKPGMPSRVRHYKSSSSTPPPGLQQINSAVQAMRGLLERMELDYVEYLTALDESLTRGKVRTRVSIFVPDPGRRYLLSTDFRHLKYKEQGEPTHPGETKYAISTLKGARDGEGTIGQAFVHNGVFAVNGLPVFRKNAPQAYISALAAKPWQLPEETVLSFGRKARSFLAVPFSLLQQPETADGVVCIDSKNPLEGISREELQVVGELLRDDYSVTLSALWRLRT